MRNRSWCLAASLLLLAIAPCQAQTAEISCINATSLNSSAPEGTRACCSEAWYTSAATSAAADSTLAHVYCGSPSSRALDHQLSSTNTSWYQYCTRATCPPTSLQACCITAGQEGRNATILPEGSQSPPATSPARSRLAEQQGVIWAIYMCPHTAPSTALFAFNLTPAAATPAATATAKDAPLNLTDVSAATLLAAACPSVPEGTLPPAFNTTFNFNSNTVDSAIGLTQGTPYMLSFFRKPSLGAVKVTLSVRLHDDQPDALIHDRVTLTLAAPSASMVAAVPTLPKGSHRRLLGGLEQGSGGGLKWAAELQEGTHSRDLRALSRRRRKRKYTPARRPSPKISTTRSSDYNYYDGARLTGMTPTPSETLTAKEIYAGQQFKLVAFAGYTYWEKSPPYLASSRLDFSTYKYLYKDKMPFAVPFSYRYADLVNTSVVNTTYGFYGPSVFPAGSKFMYTSQSWWPATADAPECSSCTNASATGSVSEGASCCPGPADTAFANNNYIYIGYYPNRRAALLSCGLVQDYITTLPIYLPTNATTLRITIHSIEAQVTTAAPACGDAAATLDPREPPMFLSVVRADTVKYWVPPSPPLPAVYVTPRLPASTATAANSPLPLATTAAALLLLWSLLQ